MDDDKITGLSILGAFSLLNTFRHTKPLMVYNRELIGKFLYEKQKGRENLFFDMFIPKETKEYKFSPHFDRCLWLYSSDIIPANFPIREVHPNTMGFLRKLNKKSLEISLEIGIEFDKTFGCDEKGDKDYRIRTEKIRASDLSDVKSANLYKKLFAFS